MLNSCLFCLNTFKNRSIKQKFCSVSCSNRFNLNHQNHVILPERSEDLAEFIGICLGDGFTDKYQVEITLNSIVDVDYIPYVKSLAFKLFLGSTISLHKRKKENAVDVEINSSMVSRFLKENGVVANLKYVPDWIIKDQKYTVACIRGLFDTEGSISYKIYQTKKSKNLYKRLNFRNYNIHLMTFVRDGLISLGFTPTMTLKKSLYLSNHQSIDLFYQKVGFHNPKLIQRSLIKTYEQYLNSITQNLKRELLLKVEF